MRLSLPLALLVLAAPAATQDGAPAGSRTEWSFALFAGSAHSFRTPLTIRQPGEPAIRLTARYSTRPWEDAPYYACRLGRRKGGRAWEAELVHHKVYLENPPPEVQRFEVSHGYNLVTLNRAWERGAWDVRLGAGVVVAHPETTVRGRELAEEATDLPGGYELSGPTLQAALGRRARLWRGLFATAEGKLTASHARVPVRDGSADVPNVAVHGVVGLGYRF